MLVLVNNFFVAIILAFFIYILPLNDKIKNYIYMVCIFLQFLILKSFINIYSLPDLANYLDLFYDTRYFSISEIINENMSSTTELGFMLFLKLISIITSNFIYVLVIITSFWTYSYFSFFKKYTTWVFIPILLLFVTEFPQSLFVLRQHLAITILLFSYKFIIERNLLKFACILLIAFLMHKSSIVFLPIYFLYGIKNKKNLILALFFSAILTTFLFQNLGAFNEVLDLQYDNYIEGERVGISNLTNFFKFLIFLIPFYYIYRTKIFDNNIFQLLFVILSFAAILSFTGTAISFTGRLVRYFTPACMIVTPFIMKGLKNKIFSILYLIFIISINFYMVFYGSSSKSIEYYNNYLFSLI